MSRDHATGSDPEVRYLTKGVLEVDVEGLSVMFGYA